MKRKRNLQHLWICFAMFLFLAVPFNVKAETETNASEHFCKIWADRSTNNSGYDQ